jgi:hypothetical protein
MKGAAVELHDPITVFDSGELFHRWNSIAEQSARIKVKIDIVTLPMKVHAQKSDFYSLSILVYRSRGLVGWLAHRRFNTFLP